MYTRKANILVALFWVLLFQPGFCLAGLLEHPCEDVEESHSHGCDCANDPCDQIQPLNVTPRLDRATPLPLFMPAFAAVVADTVPLVVAASVETSVFRFAATRDRPYPDSDLPLLN